MTAIEKRSPSERIWYRSEKVVIELSMAIFLSVRLFKGYAYFSFIVKK
ncbi:hypothetical protein JEG43_06165 [Anoxybacillus sp. LAT_35]|nr:hypothetical protein [Anoxybacillus sp. LAT_35]